MTDKIELLSLNAEELLRFVTENLGESKFRAKQIAEWLKRGAEIDEMTNLSAALRAKIGEIAVANPVSIQESYKSKLDGTEKFLYRLRDGNLIEGVVMRYHYGDTLCVSTQVGCRMGCAFCASTLEGRVRNLSAGDILGQVVAANRHIQAQDAARRVHNIVLMGSGEPFDNYDNVVKFLRLVNSDAGLNISIRNISLSTCGLVPRIDQFCNEGLPVTLSLSLHAPNDVIRQKIMPIAHAYAYEDVIAACRRYSEKTGRRVAADPGDVPPVQLRAAAVFGTTYLGGNAMTDTIIEILNDITGADDGEITPETELFEEGILDSFGLVELLVRLEQFQVKLDVANLTREEISTPAKLAALLG